MPEWIKFILEVIPPRSKKGGSPNIMGMRNRKGKDEIAPGGKNYPDMGNESNRSLRLEWHEKWDDLLLHLNINHGQAISIQNQGLYDATILTDEDAEIMKETVFGILPAENNGAS